MRTALLILALRTRSVLPDDGFTLWLSDAARRGQFGEPLAVRFP